MNVASKLGPHCLRTTDGARRLLDAGARVVKLVDDFGLANDVAPGVIVIGRSYSNFTAESQRGENPASAADRFVSSQLTQYTLNPKIRIWEGHNEPVWSNATDMAWYAEFESYRIRTMASLGLRCCIGNFSTGNPDLPLWNAFLPAIREALRNNGLLGVHEYSSPWMWWMTGRYQVDPNADAGDVGWTTLRYRQVIRDYLKPAGLEAIPIVITECGLDRVGQVREGMATGNWRTDAAWWNAQNSADAPIPFDPDGEKYYAEQLKWYDRELQKDNSVVGATIFTVGSYGAPWADYDIDGTRVIQYLAEHIAAEAGNPNPPPPNPTPDPTETPMPINLSELNFGKTYEWDAKPGAPEPGNTILIPLGMNFSYVYDPNVRVTWQDIKQGSPTYGQNRTSDNKFLKPEVMPKTQAQMPDIPFPVGVPTLSKCFKGFGPIWVLYTVALNMVAGSKYKLTWPVWPNLLASDDGGVKVYADDPAAGWMRLRVTTGEWGMAINSVSPDSSWYNGRDFAFGHWFTPQVVVDATQPVMTVGLECLSIFGLKDSDFMIAPPTMELVSSGGSTEPPPIPAGTLRGLAQQTLAAAHQAEAGVQQVVAATTALNGLIG